MNSNWFGTDLVGEFKLVWNWGIQTGLNSGLEQTWVGELVWIGELVQTDLVYKAKLKLFN